MHLQEDALHFQQHCIYTLIETNDAGLTVVQLQFVIYRYGQSLEDTAADYQVSPWVGALTYVSTCKQFACPLW